MKHAAIIFNPKAGAGAAPAHADATRQRLQESGWQTSVFPTKRAGHAGEIATALPGEIGRIVVVGGDGTLRETVEGLGERARRLDIGFVPMGNSNVVGREIGIPLEPSAAIEVAATGRSRTLDVGTAAGRMFLAMASVGYDSIVVAGVDRVRQHPWGGVIYRRGGSNFLYGIFGAAALLRLRPRRFRLTVDGRLVGDRFCSVIVCNSETYAAGWAAAPGARPDDGILDHEAYKRAAAPLVAWGLVASVLRLRSPAFIADYGSGTEYEISSDRPFLWQADGDPLPPTNRLEIGILPGFMRMLVPR